MRKWSRVQGELGSLIKIIAGMGEVHSARGDRPEWLDWLVCAKQRQNSECSIRKMI